MTTWASLLDDAARAFSAAGLDTPSVDARWIVEDVAGRRDGAGILNAHGDAPAYAVRRVHELITRRARGEPLQYVVGYWAFRDRKSVV